MPTYSLQRWLRSATGEGSPLLDVEPRRNRCAVRRDFDMLIDAMPPCCPRPSTLLPLLFAAAACGGSESQVVVKAGVAKTPPPDWLLAGPIEDDALCGVGVAGAAYDPSSPYPKMMSEERAVKNLAGAISTSVEEAVIDRETTHRASVTTARAVHVDEALIERVKNSVETRFWLDVEGSGPFTAKGFTYARSCMSLSKAADLFTADEKALRRHASGGLASPDDPPNWLAYIGKRGDRLCAVGFTRPMFHPDKTFEAVVEDVRAQLATVITSLVSSYFEELTTNRGQIIEMMHVASNEALAKGVVVTDYWYDRDGMGPQKEKRSTYGFGCAYPLDVLRQSAAAAAKALPQEEKTVAAVRERAEKAFGALDAEIEKREGSGPSAATVSEP